MDGNGSWENDEARERGLWMLYSAKPIRLVEKERAAQFTKHWSELQSIEQPGRRAVVSDYMHYMWHARGLYVKPFLILQGPFGGTPAKYTEQERAFLKNSHLQDDEMDLGAMAPCPFDERVVQQIGRRDRLVQMGNDLAKLDDLDTAAGLGREFDEAGVIGRQTYVDTLAAMVGPAVELYKRMYATKQRSAQAASQLPPAPDGLAHTIAGWAERFVHLGENAGITPAAQRTLHGTTITVS